MTRERGDQSVLALHLNICGGDMLEYRLVNNDQDSWVGLRLGRDAKVLSGLVRP